MTKKCANSVMRRFSGGDPDSHLYLMKIGAESSIPYLIRSLKRIEGTGSCSKQHGIDGLKNLSREDFEDDMEVWENWADSCEEIS